MVNFQAKDQTGQIKQILRHALDNRASDIHLEPTTDGLKIRYRVDGMLRHIQTLPLEISRKLIVALKVMCDMDIAESRVPQDGRIGEKYFGGELIKGLDLRVSTLPCVSNTKGDVAEKAVLRLLRQQNSFKTVADLGFSRRSRSKFEGYLNQPQGLVILTGPTGSGKTSTLYTSLVGVATEEVNIITVEDPVEYLLPNITQTQVNEAAGMTFAKSLKAILRQDPDIIMLGEIRDAETVETSIRAALTGHLVLTTLHTNDAIGAIPRLKDLGPDPALISDALLGVVAQRLIRVNCPHCSEPYQPIAADWHQLDLTPKEFASKNWRKGRGCEHCFGSGYLGREAIVELLHVDDAVRQIIYEGSITQLRHYLQQSEFESFRRAAIAKVINGITTVEEICRVLPRSVLQNPQPLLKKRSPTTLINAS
ncbi:type II secretion system protein E (GspE) [[Leptolyngbya] sp. PCC 7376]|uniref:GspE/PulE family protein n=1 Tax=[Leptolyngbya] sp. PCC 7376 TaxID=111781 RepID=UPI00029F48EE|nr:GspE/PulE family protein [[Leptolyngbya] sp. PCC 7376]AFY37561.1 type II secretion system protein E (GspE) [[Leptolyngbya] sp. PCC 7376]